MPKVYERLAILHPNEVLPYVVFAARKKTKDPLLLATWEREYAGYKVWITSLRYQVFAAKGLRCAHCGIEGRYFALERDLGSKGRCHLNLYALNLSGEEVLLTKDHILLKSQGGADRLENLQPMCVRCNKEKADRLEVDSG